MKKIVINSAFILSLSLTFNTSFAQNVIGKDLRAINPRAIELLASRNPISWYTVKKKRATPAGQSQSVIQSKTLGNNIRSEVGVSLPRVPNEISAVGAPTFNIASTGYCETQKVNLDYLNERGFSLLNFRTSANTVIFPGAFINAASLLDISPTFYSAANRGPLTINMSISNPKSQTPSSFPINDFGVNNINLLNSNLRDKHFGAAIPPVFTFEMTEIKSIEHFNATFNYSAGLMLPLAEFGIPVDLSQGITASGTIASTRKLRSYIVRFIQPMYQYSVAEADMNKFFSTANQASQHSAAGYVESVTFGRIVFMSFKSSEDSLSISAALSARFGVTITGGELADAQLGVNISGDAKANFSNKITEFKAFVYGGDGAIAARLANNPEEVFNFIQSSSAYTLRTNTGALPIEYTVKRVSDGKQIGVRSFAQSTVQDCINPRYKIDIISKDITCNKVVEGPFDNDEDIFGTMKVDNILLFEILENDKKSIKANVKSDISKLKNIKQSVTINEIKDLRLTFSSQLKDWEALIKPAYKAKQDGDLVFTMENRIRQLYDLQPGNSIIIDSRDQKIPLFENGDASSSRITYNYEVKVTRL